MAVAVAEWPLAAGQAKALVVSVGDHDYELTALSGSNNENVS